MPRIPIADTIIEKDGKIVMLKRKYFPENKLDILGGYVEDNESVENAAIREAKEESGYDVELLEKLGQYNYFDRGEKTMHVFVAKIIGGNLEVSDEGIPLWIKLTDIKSKDMAFPQVHVDVLNDFIKLRAYDITIK